jgi:hypothetical protein
MERGISSATAIRTFIKLLSFTQVFHLSDPETDKYGCGMFDLLVLQEESIFLSA